MLGKLYTVVVSLGFGEEGNAWDLVGKETQLHLLKAIECVPTRVLVESTPMTFESIKYLRKG